MRFDHAVASGGQQRTSRRVYSNTSFWQLHVLWLQTHMCSLSWQCCSIVAVLQLRACVHAFCSDSEKHSACSAEGALSIVQEKHILHNIKCTVACHEFIYDLHNTRLVIVIHVMRRATLTELHSRSQFSRGGTRIIIIQYTLHTASMCVRFAYIVVYNCSTIGLHKGQPVV
jgi:hypothetical protein